MKICVIDYSMLRHIATAAVKKFQDQNAAFGHLNCIAQKMSEILYSLKTIHKPDTWVMAMDSKPYWRDREMYEFYKATTRFLSYENDHYWEAYGCLYKSEDGILKKCTKKEATPVLESDIPAWDDFDTIAEEFPLPKYKGQRKPQDYSWLDCDPEIYFEFMDKLPPLYARLLGSGIVVKHLGAEADDIAGVICARAHDKGNQVVLISGDSDWAQLPAYYPSVTFDNPYRGESWTYAQKPEIMNKVRAKIVGGDPGDGIKGCKHNTAWGPIGETKAKDIVESGKISEVVDSSYLNLNRRLVALKPDYMPVDIVIGIEQSIKAKTRSDMSITWEELHLPQARRNELELASKAKDLWGLVTEK